MVRRVNGPATEGGLMALAVALGAREVPGWSAAEEALAPGETERVSKADIAEARRAILGGGDPLGDRFMALRSPRERRGRGATYTPPAIVRAMVDWAERHGRPARVVDAGLGSGRFLVEAAGRFPVAELLGIELDPVAAMLGRANLAALGLGARARVIVGDYREVVLGPVEGKTLFLGNPPYVRHHAIEPRWKGWLAREAEGRGLPFSRLAGLHVHFALATAGLARPGDFGTFVTAAEWLDVNYGALMRGLFLGPLGGRRVVVIEPTAAPFADALSTAAITSFAVGDRPSAVSFRRVAAVSDVGSDGGGLEVDRARLEREPRWSRLTRPARKGPSGHVELGELCRVHRGQVTGANRLWIAGGHSLGLPAGVLFPSVTRARELFGAGRALLDVSPLRRVIDLPADLDALGPDDRAAVDRFLARVKAAGGDAGYVARNRRAWWSVGLRAPAPILATYMARRPPAFVRNTAGARHINIAHGIYPRSPMGPRALARLADHLATATRLDDGRTYAGGLTKFEPREMERLPVPGLDALDESC